MRLWSLLSSKESSLERKVYVCLKCYETSKCNGKLSKQRGVYAQGMPAPSILSAFLWENKKQQVVQSTVETLFQAWMQCYLVLHWNINSAAPVSFERWQKQ